MFYQKQPNLDVYFRKTKTGHNVVKTHLHGFYELHCCIEGELHLTIDGKLCILNAGESALIFPHQPHSFVRTGGKGYFFTFGKELIGTFHNQFASLLPEDGRFPFAYDFSAISDSCDVYAIKSFLYAMCSAASKMSFIHAPTEGRVLLEKIFFLTEEHFKDCEFSLGTLAELLDYDYGYISKYFLKLAGMKYGYYLNQRRITYAERLLQNGTVDSISDVAFDCGYGSVRTFNRNFKEIEGKTPAEYMKDTAVAGK